MQDEKVTKRSKRGVFINSPLFLKLVLSLPKEREWGGLSHFTVRVALTGKTASPGIYDVVLLLGKQRTIERLKNAFH